MSSLAHQSVWLGCCFDGTGVCGGVRQGVALLLLPQSWPTHCGLRLWLRRSRTAGCCAKGRTGEMVLVRGSARFASPFRGWREAWRVAVPYGSVAIPYTHGQPSAGQHHLCHSSQSLQPSSSSRCAAEQLRASTAASNTGPAPMAGVVTPHWGTQRGVWGGGRGQPKHRVPGSGLEHASDSWSGAL